MPNLLQEIFQSSKKRSLITKAFLYLFISLALWLIGLIFYSRLIEFIALMFLASTFLPMPADTYVLYMADFFGPLKIALIAGIVNSIAVIFEKYWLIDLMKFGYFEKFSLFFSKTRFTKYTDRYMFLSLFFSAFSIIPFEPFRLIAVIKKYSNIKYFVATFFGRGLRYYFLAIVGRQFVQYDLLGFIILLSLGGFLWGLYKIIRKKK